ncbi:MAG: hypothetical protein R3A79_19395 [Nannocystaceae bacterium]
MSDHPFLREFRDGTFSLPLAKAMAAMQVGYNLDVIVALTRMRRRLADHPEFICDLLDPLLATEFGGDLESVGLRQHGVTHIKSIYDLTDSLGMSAAERRMWGDAASRFFDEALTGIIGGDCAATAMGGLFANEVFATAWYPAYLEGFLSFSRRTGLDLDLTFLASHSEIEVAHVEHVSQLLAWRDRLDVDRDAFEAGYRAFSAALERKFSALREQLARDLASDRGS